MVIKPNNHKDIYDLAISILLLSIIRIYCFLKLPLLQRKNNLCTTFEQSSLKVM